MNTIKIIIYTSNSGKQPFIDWQKNLDLKAKSVVIARLSRIRSGNFGDCKIIKGGNGIWELRIDYGSGYRIYYGKKGSEIIVLLIGGDKGNQKSDIEKSKKYWLQYKEDSK